MPATTVIAEQSREDVPAAWSERSIDERTHMIEIQGEIGAGDGALLADRIVELAREGKRWLVVSCPESMRYPTHPFALRPW
jgi:hypothetical protein